VTGAGIMFLSPEAGRQIAVLSRSSGGPCSACSMLGVEDSGWAMVHRPCTASLGSCCMLPPPCSSPCSLPDHPISQLLKKLQCAVYTALYPIVSQAAVSAVSAAGCCSLPPDADRLLAPGSRRLRSSQSLYCMLSPPEPSTAPRSQDGPPATPSTPPLHPSLLDKGADSSPAGPPSPLVDASSRLPDKDSSFEDLEQFLATSERWGRGPGGHPEPQTPGAKREPLLEHLKSTVKDIHNAIGELQALVQELSLSPSASKCSLLRALL
jgi:hypothetical protein